MKFVKYLKIGAVCFLLFSAIATSYGQEITNIARYRGMEIRLPEIWTFSAEEVEQGVAYQITCLGLNNTGDANTILLQRYDVEMDLGGLLNITKGALQVSIPGDPFFSQNRTGMFGNYRTLYCTFKGNIGRYRYSGQIMIFHNNGKTFLLLHQGDEKYYESGLNDKILATIQL